MVLAVALLAACSSPNEPAPPVGISGLYTATARPSVQIFLYDDAPVSSPDGFFLRAEDATGTSYWWGTYAEQGDSLLFTMFADALPDTPRITGAAWTTRLEAFVATPRSFGALRFTRTP